MLLVVILGLFFVTAAEEPVDEAQLLRRNCTRLLAAEEEETTLDPTSTFPTTSFTCWGRYDGYYADIEVDCTIFHYCQTWQFPTGLNETVKWDFACPQSTIFNQKILSCTPPNISFDCQESPNYYWVNYNLTATTTAETTLAPEFSTPVTNVGQQLIVGGVGSPANALPNFEPISEIPSLALDDSSLSSNQPHRETTGESEAITFPRQRSMIFNKNN